MKINLFTTALVAITGIALIGTPLTSRAQSTNAAPAMTSADTGTMTPKKAKKKSGKTQYAGSVTAISDTSLTVASTTKTLTLAIAPTTKFAIKTGKKLTPAKASDFAVGDSVTGSYSTDSTGALTAASVHKKAPATTTTTTSATAAPAAAAPATPAAQ